MFGSHERHRKWLMKYGTAAPAEILGVRARFPESRHGQEVGVYQFLLWVDAVIGEPFEAQVTDEWLAPTRDFPQAGLKVGVLYDSSNRARVCLSGAPVPDRSAGQAQSAVTFQVFGAGAGAVLSAMNLGNFGSADSFARLGQLTNQLHEGALSRAEFEAEVQKLFGQ